ncbi:MAG: MBL fold metallo-hydrolase [Candidatus Kapaibacteriota bacterium]
MIQVAGYEIDLLETCTFGLDGGAMFGVVPKTLWERQYTVADGRNRIPMTARSLLLRGHGRTILVDTGNSPRMSQKELEIYAVDFSVHTLEQSLALVGVSVHDVTDVILTHLHFDHVGGAVTLDATELIPRFPRARYYVQSEQYRWAQQPALKDRASFIPAMYEPLANHGVLELLDGSTEVFPGVRVEPVYGHTAAMQMVSVSDTSTGLLYPADLMPTGAHVPLPYVMGYDNHPLVTIEEKQRWLPIVLERDWLVVFEHDALRQAAHLVHGEKGVQLGELVVLTTYPSVSAQD